MKIESTSFTQSDLLQFLDDLLDHERFELADRLEKASARLAKIGHRIEAGPGSDSWGHHEVLAPSAVLSKFFRGLVPPNPSGQPTRVGPPSHPHPRGRPGRADARDRASELLG